MMKLKVRGLCLAWLLASFGTSADGRHNTVEGRFTPPMGQTLMFIGQDSSTIDAYHRAVPQDPVEAVTLYTTLKSPLPEHTLDGLLRPANWGAGLVDFDLTLASFPKAALAIGLAFDACNSEVEHAVEIASGRYDKSLKVLSEQLARMSPRPVFLRIGYEFDGLWNCYNPQSYKAAYRHIHAALQTAKADNVVTVWQSATWPAPQFAGERAALYDFRDDTHLMRWYPGDEVVDWAGISTFYRDLGQWDLESLYTPEEAQAKVLTFARRHNKPLMIAEAAPQGFRIGALTHSFIGKNVQTARSAEQIWQAWFRPFFDFVYANQDVIRAVAYINTNWESQSMWFCAEGASPPADNCKNGNWGDSRIQANALIKQRWLEQVNNPKRWVQAKSADTTANPEP